MDDILKLLDEATPGPWQLDDFSCISAGFQGLFYYTINDDGVHATNPADPALIVAAVNAVPELLALREEVGRLREALKKIAKGKYGKCPIEGHWPPEKPCTICGDLGFFSDEPQYDPTKDGHCVEGGARVIARAALNQEPGQ